MRERKEFEVAKINSMLEGNKKYRTYEKKFGKQQTTYFEDSERNKIHDRNGIIQVITEHYENIYDDENITQTFTSRYPTHKERELQFLRESQLLTEKVIRIIKN